MLDINAAIKSPTDYSVDFLHRMEAANAFVYSRTGIRLRHDADMNYSASQKLSLWLDALGNVTVGHQSAQYEIDFLISSKVNAFTTMRLEKSESGQWSQMPLHRRIDFVEEYEAKIGECLQQQGYELIPQERLHQLAEGHVTDIDGRPATTFEVLFSELY